MRIFCPLFLVLVAADGNLLRVSALNHVALPLSNTTVLTTDTQVDLHDPTAGKLSRDDEDDEERVFESIRRFAEKGADLLPNALRLSTPNERGYRQLFRDWEKMLSKLKKQSEVIGDKNYITKFIGNRRNGGTLTAFFHQLRSMKKKYPVDEFQKVLFESTKGSYSTKLNELWLKSNMKPKDVLEMVRDWDGGIVLWIRYTELIRKEKGHKAFSIEKTLKLLEDRAPGKPDWYYVGMFDEMRQHKDVQELAETMQKLRYNQMIKEEGVDISQFARRVHTKEEPIISLKKDSPTYRAFRTFVLEYAAIASKDLQKATDHLLTTMRGDELAKYLIELEEYVRLFLRRGT